MNDFMRKQTDALKISILKEAAIFGICGWHMAVMMENMEAQAEFEESFHEIARIMEKRADEQLQDNY